LNASILKFLKAFNGKEGLLTSAILHNKKKYIFPVNKPSFCCCGQRKADKEMFNHLWLSENSAKDMAPV